MFDPKKIKAFTFDTGGTVLDWHTGFKKGFEKLEFYEKSGFKSDEMANLFRKKSLEIITSQGDKELVNFDTAHRMALEQILNEKKIRLDKEDIKFLSYETPANLKVWKDFLSPFEELRKKVSSLQKNRSQALQKIATQRAKAKSELLKNLNPIIKEYMQEKQIREVEEEQYLLLKLVLQEILY